MTTLERQITEALDAEDRALYEDLGEQGLIDQFKGMFAGKLRWVTVAGMIVGMIINGFFLYAAWKFFTVPETDAKLYWGGGAWFAAMFVGFMKVWFWMRMETNRTLREIKRLELQVARLSERE